MVALTVILFLALFAVEMLYIRLAYKTGIGVVRMVGGTEAFVPVGGGVVFALAAIVALFIPPWQGSWFAAAVVGGVALAALSFVDDIIKLSPRLRLVSQAIVIAAVLVPLLYGANTALYLLALVGCVGYLNASNFMDGSNGMLAGYSGVVLASLVVATCVGLPAEGFPTDLPQLDGIRLLCSCLLVAVAVFAMFNFRSRAMVFSGDVGSITVGYFIAFSLTALIAYSGRLSMAVFVLVFFVDTFFTFVQRLVKGENVLSPHKKHLYQLLLQAGYPQLTVAACYALLQLAVNAGWFLVPAPWQNCYSIAVSLVVFVAYIRVKSKFLKR